MVGFVKSPLLAIQRRGVPLNPYGRCAVIPETYTLAISKLHRRYLVFDCVGQCRGYATEMERAIAEFPSPLLLEALFPGTGGCEYTSHRR